ncbi:MAG: Enoyl-[acyl-carrier-protein] reductase FabI [Candidatus Midichloria mitochondrii]|uniref:Enoyl-[acyl-carrier-protein] reductase [NADH] n=1 Tax=Midichloria mitochondrii (strain IricVA) TaxID=696127 RepID=F7XVJ5_MIDMI|nr:SDR family oxidoreductase [Candidatus Midichloria mitochondrii]AEI88694.1 enoyl-(acyl-carrier-protein) reductase [Candidatus Midichloria mitochondrii IricVA]MDJ1256640.1 SDR family oxidoreductase [Candidatus Midichloria mitochondrii]MDJ1288366.1 SDR family oxidoreductase [Candidatus Midichloria mitochondrii]MDJ1299204.1 SDR family oxidoreductase [Candidatus Midichloria mitochondrii]MDJ1313329.1 SDR family oxidoreductase [Candidatus Midichloria mitochondrii]
MSKLLEGKKGLIMGLANDKSMAWGIAQECANHGAKLAFSYQGEILEKRVTPLAAGLGSDFLVMCDVCDQESLKKIFALIKEKWGKLDFLVHAIAFSNKDELSGRYLDTSLENFALTMNVSCYSFAEVSKYAAELMTDGGSIITLSYYGAEKAVPNYNVMGVAKAALEASVRYIATDLGKNNIRVNAISAGPVRTLAASGISDFKSVLSWTEQNAPLRRNIDIHDVGRSALYLLSDLSSGVTGEILHVDSGYHSVGMKMSQDSN